ncbi:MAG: ArgE/DapE family deacylase [Candidatus Choladocola sp.]|nr:ArgE/DapE family deacylase [Candidatus Choladocola sp.]
MERLKQLLEEKKDEYIGYLKDLVAIDTHDLGHGIDGGLEEKGQEYLERLCLSMGATVVRDPMTEECIQECLEKYHEGNPGHNYDNRWNLYARFAGKGGKSLMFNGHMDTMPSGDVSLWKYPPHQPTIEDGKLYGLGSADMKAGLMAGVMAVKLLQDAGYELPGDVIITSVCDEEGGGNGSMVAAMGGQRADGVVVCEGTSDELILAHMGFVFFKVKVTGKSNHSGAKWKGVSAIEKSWKLIRELDELEHRWLLTYKHPLLPAPNLNVGVIEGGTAGSTVAGECTFQMCVHYLPQVMSYEQVVEEVTGTLRRTAESDLWMREHQPEITVYQAGGSFEMEQAAPFPESFRKAYEKAMDRPVKTVGSPAGCDSRIWRTIGGCPTIQFGPGNLEQCHAVNEYVEIAAYLESILIYASLILQWCKGGENDE